MRIFCSLILVTSARSLIESQTTRPWTKSCHGHSLTKRPFAVIRMTPTTNQVNVVIWKGSTPGILSLTKKGRNKAPITRMAQKMRIPKTKVLQCTVIVVAANIHSSMDTSSSSWASLASFRGYPGCRVWESVPGTSERILRPQSLSMDVSTTAQSIKSPSCFRFLGAKGLTSKFSDLTASNNGYSVGVFSSHLLL